MTTEPTHHPLRRRHEGNPFPGVSMPLPLEGWNLRATDIFRECPLARHLGSNAGWLQARPRTSDAIEAALFPAYALCGMEHDEVRSLLNRALWDVGYNPDDEETDNPTWTWTKGK
jgi:hypothetical protein